MDDTGGEADSVGLVWPLGDEARVGSEEDAPGSDVTGEAGVSWEGCVAW